MTKYLIHAVPDRMWYVMDYLVPSMVGQGISEKDIRVYNDENEEGNLMAFRKSLADLPEMGGTWHLQDDVLISSKFKEVTDCYDRGIVCGFCSSYSDPTLHGKVEPCNMWYSFPCIRIPNRIAWEFLKWLDTDALSDPTYAKYINGNKYDDTLFREFIRIVHGGTKVINLKPNIVEHIDYLIGGSISNPHRSNGTARSVLWTEPKLVDALKKSLGIGENGLNGWYRNNSIVATRKID